MHATEHPRNVSKQSDWVIHASDYYIKQNLVKRGCGRCIDTNYNLLKLNSVITIPFHRLHHHHHHCAVVSLLWLGHGSCFLICLPLLCPSGIPLVHLSMLSSCQHRDMHFRFVRILRMCPAQVRFHKLIFSSTSVTFVYSFSHIFFLPDS